MNLSLNRSAPPGRGRHLLVSTIVGLGAWLILKELPFVRGAEKKKRKRDSLYELYKLSLLMNDPIKTRNYFFSGAGAGAGAGAASGAFCSPAGAGAGAGSGAFCSAGDSVPQCPDGAKAGQVAADCYQLVSDPPNCPGGNVVLLLRTAAEIASGPLQPGTQLAFDCK
jgi:hypothetical protein